jgi:hypothetical protein
LETLYFTSPDTWVGGFYGLAIEVGQRNDDRLLTALKAVWSYPDLIGGYLHDDLEPHLQEQVVPQIKHIESGKLRGIARLPNLSNVACVTGQVREDSGIDWLGFYVPMGALGNAYPVGGFPFAGSDREDTTWRIPLDQWLSDIGRHVFQHVPFDLALIGHEVSGDTYAEEIVSEGIPEERWIGYMWPEHGQLQYYPCNILDAPWTFE